MGESIVTKLPRGGHFGSDDPAIAAASVEESTAYERSVRGVEIQSVRTGEGHGSTLVQSDVGADFVVTSVTTGFPMVSSTTIDDGVAAAIAIRSAPPGARWCGIDVKAGMVVVYGPGVEHTAVNPEGMSFAFAVLAVDDLSRVADSMQAELAGPGEGEVFVPSPSPASVRLHEALANHCQETAQLRTSADRGSRVLASLTSVLGRPPHNDRLGTHSQYVGRRVARACIEYAETIGRVPTIPELCMAAGVSERGLHRAFTATFGIPPSLYFRRWGLDAVRKRLLDTSESVDGAVTREAFALGFKHLGRFAGYYRQQYGESPSETLKQSLRSPGMVPAS